MYIHVCLCLSMPIYAFPCLFLPAPTVFWPIAQPTSAVPCLYSACSFTFGLCGVGNHHPYTPSYYSHPPLFIEREGDGYIRREGYR